MSFIVWGIAGMLFYFKCTESQATIDDPIVRVEQGGLRGSRMISIGGNDSFYAFRGIPYAKPPLGNLRFQAPQPPEPWDGIRDATSDTEDCMQQVDTLETVCRGSEDCLYLNVYTRSLSTVDEPVPVLFLIHGGLVGGSASSTQLDPTRFMAYKDRPIVVVTAYYRLTVFSFLSTGDSHASGNYGFIDQIAALQWVQKNIRQFGGDPSKVTIVGVSFGGVAATYHLVSPMAKGLFRGMVTMSGPLVKSLITTRQDALNTAKHLGLLVWCFNGNSKDLIACLRSKPAKDLCGANLVMQATSFRAFPYAPVIEDRETGKYLFDDPKNLFERGEFHKVPVMMGTTKHEAAYIVLPIIQFYNYMPVLTEFVTFTAVIPFLMKLLLGYDIHRLFELSSAIKEEYKGEYNFNVKKQLKQFCVDMSSDAAFRAGADKLARWIANSTPVYFYTFDYYGNVSTRYNEGDLQIDHVDNFRYLERLNLLSGEDREIGEMHMRHLLNFVTYLNPTLDKTEPKWNPTPAAPQIQHFKYGNGEMGMKEGYYPKNMKFWNSDVPKIMDEN